MMRKNKTMKTLKIFFRKFVMLAVVFVHAGAAVAQIYQIGDVYEFPDGSKGVICYVNPDNPVEGWVVALNDVGWVSRTNNQSYFLLDEGVGIPSGIEAHTYESVARYGISEWSYEGKKNTKLLLDSRHSPAAEAVDFYNGWYIPDAIQLRHIFGLIPFIETSIIDAGGDPEGMRWMYAYNNSDGHDYWSSTRTGDDFVVVRGSQYFYDPRNPIDHSNTTRTKVRIRAVRDFGTNAYAYWLDNPKSASMQVSPDATTAYQAYVIFNADTFNVTSSAILHETYDKDTLYETVSASSLPYTSQVNPIFTNLDISTPQSEAYTHRVTLQTVYGCDSVITLKLKVVSAILVEITDSVCSNAFPYSTADTVFLDGTVSGNYLLHRTTAQSFDSLVSLNLYVIPPISAEATLTCPPDTNVVLAYGACDTLLAIGFPLYTHSAALDGVSYTITNNAPADSIYPVGTTMVTWTVEDECGLSLDCNQQVEVVYPPCGTPADSVTDFDGFRYSSVRIGCQCWTGENARSTHYSDGTLVDIYYLYNGLDSLENIYGKMYSWYSAVRVPEGDNSAAPADSIGYFGPYVQGICPEGWALPTMDEYLIMLAAAGGTAEQVKSASSLYWMSGYEGTSPNSGFNARGAGRYDAISGQYKDLMLYANFWTVNDNYAPVSAVSVYVPYTCAALEPELNVKYVGFSVRCVRKR